MLKPLCHVMVRGAGISHEIRYFVVKTLHPCWIGLSGLISKSTALSAREIVNPVVLRAATSSMRRSGLTKGSGVRARNKLSPSWQNAAT